ncbi:MAG: hypothetical protein M3Q92_08890, partial [Actinomycetota bacterium]|nr:hypothetical protein [Actinomycetota bacterium]
REEVARDFCAGVMSGVSALTAARMAAREDYSVLIPTKPAGDSDLKPAGHHSDLKAARSDGVPVGRGG